MKVYKIIFILTLISLFSVQATVACRPFNEPPPCYNFWQYDVVFVGTVKNVEEKSTENNDFPKVEIEVEQNFKGMKSQKVFTYNYGSSVCATTFRKGGKFLIYGKLDEKKANYFGAGPRTQSIYPEAVLSDFDFFKTLGSSTPNYWIWGTISRGNLGTPIEGAKAEIFDGKQKLTGISDKNGDLKIVVSKEGKYIVRVYLPKGLAATVSNWIEQWKTVYKGNGRTKKGMYIEYEVEVKNNQCGWFDTTVFDFKN
jgi:hypothetical protein